MPSLIIQDSLCVNRPKKLRVKNGTRVLEALLNTYQRLDPKTVKMHFNGEHVLHTDFEIFRKEMHDDDVFTVTHEPKGIVEDVLGLAGDVIGGVIEVFVDTDLPDIDTERGGSPNNSFTSQRNIVRAFQQKPVVCGSPVIYPDLINESLDFYVNNEKNSENYFYICFGTLNGGNVRAGESSIAGGGFSATVTQYKPVSGTTNIPDYRISKFVDAVDGQTVRGTNEGAVGTTYTLTQSTTSNTYIGGVFTAYVDQTTDSDQLKTDFDGGIGDISLSYEACIFDGFESCSTQTVNGTGVITSMTLNAGEYTIVIGSFNGPTSFDGTYTVNSLSTILSAGIGPFANPIQCEKMFFNFVFEQGLKNTVDMDVTVYELDAQDGTRTGVEETFSVSYTEDSPNDPIRRTFEINIANGRDWYEFEVTRTNEESQDTTKPDVPTLERVFCIQELGSTDFDNATLMKVEMRAGRSAGTGRSVDNKINIRNGQVEMPSYDVNTQTILPNAPSRKAADAVLFVWQDFLGRSADLLDLDSLYEIQNRLDIINPELAQFDFTFDDIQQSAGERLDVILNVMRVRKYFDGEKYRFWRDERYTDTPNLISRTDIAASSEREYTLTRSNFVSGKFNGVQVEYIDRLINKKAYIYRTPSGGSILDTPSSNPKKIALTGCQSETSAINRAELEARRLIYENWSLTDTFLDSQRFLSRGDVILYNEVYEGGDAFGGQIREIDGGTATVFEKLTLDPMKNYQVYYTNQYGETIGPQSITSSTESTFTTASLAEGYLSGEDGAKLGSRYYITEVNDSVQRLYRVTDRDVRSGYVQLSMINYRDEIYGGDDLL